MRTAADRSPPPGDITIDDGWRDLVSSAPPPPPAPPRDAYESPRSTLPADVHTSDQQGCVTRVQFGAERVPEQPGFDASDRRLWRVAGGLMGLATVVLLLLGVLTFRLGSEPQAQAPSLLHAPVMAPASAAAPSLAQSAQPAIGVGRPLLAQPALRHVKHARKHKKLAAR